MNTIQVIIVGSNGLFRDLLRASLGQYDHVRVIGDFSDGELTEQLAPGTQPDVAVVDVDSHHGSRALRAARLLHHLWPGLKVLFLADLPDPSILPLIAGRTPASRRHPEWSWLLKSSVHRLPSLVRAIESAASGLLVLDAGMTPLVGKPSPGIWVKLPSRQLEILGLIARGYNNAAIAHQLGIARKTVENQVNALYHQLGLDRHDSPFHPRVRAALLYLHAAPGD